MNDQKLKIRIQVAQQSHPIDELNPAQQEKTEHDEPSLDWRKISAGLLLISLIFGFISYFIYYDADGREQQQAAAKIYPIITTGETLASPVEIPLDQVDVVEVENKMDLSLTEDKELVNPASTETPNKVNVTAETQATTVNPPKDSNDTISTASDSLISNTLEDKPQVIRAQLTSAIHQREPVDIIDHVWLEKNKSEKIYFFVHLRDLSGQRVNVRWHYQDKEIAKVPLSIGSQNWRTYSSKSLNKNKLGAWRVTLHDQSGKLLSKRNFTVGKRP
jgi:hypothetical protein